MLLWGADLTEGIVPRCVASSQEESPDSTRHVASPTNIPWACIRPVAGAGCVVQLCMAQGAGPSRAPQCRLG